MPSLNAEVETPTSRVAINELLTDVVELQLHLRTVAEQLGGLDYPRHLRERRVVEHLNCSVQFTIKDDKIASAAFSYAQTEASVNTSNREGNFSRRLQRAIYLPCMSSLFLIRRVRHANPYISSSAFVSQANQVSYGATARKARQISLAKAQAVRYVCKLGKVPAAAKLTETKLITYPHTE